MQWRVVLVVVVVVVVSIIGAGHYLPVWNIISRNVCCQLERSTITHHSIYIYGCMGSAGMQLLGLHLTLIIINVYAHKCCFCCCCFDRLADLLCFVCHHHDMYG